MAAGRMKRMLPRVGQKANKPRALSRPAKAQVASIAKKVINSQAETKMVAFYNGPVAATSPPANSTGLYADKAIVSHNQFINQNATDILKVIPDVAMATAGVPSDNTRVGRFLNPVSGKMRCRVQISPVAPGSTGWANNVQYDLTVVAYLLQSVTYKTYRALYANNDFTKMLDVMDGTTTQFDGTFSAACLPVEKGYYKVLGTKKIYLRSSGVTPTNATGIALVGNNNSHKLQHEFTWNWGKHLPKKLVYPEDAVTVADGLNEPLNSSIFWAVGYYNTDGTVVGPGSGSAINIGIDYTSIMKFKDF